MGLFVALKNQFEEEEKERKKQEKEANGSVDVGNYLGQTSSMINSAMSQAKMPSTPSLPHVSMPHP